MAALTLSGLPLTHRCGVPQHNTAAGSQGSYEGRWGASGRTGQPAIVGNGTMCGRSRCHNHMPWSFLGLFGCKSASKSSSQHHATSICCPAEFSHHLVPHRGFHPLPPPPLPPAPPGQAPSPGMLPPSTCSGSCCLHQWHNQQQQQQQQQQGHLTIQEQGGSFTSLAAAAAAVLAAGTVCWCLRWSWAEV